MKLKLFSRERGETPGIWTIKLKRWWLEKGELEWNEIDLVEKGILN